MEKKKDENQMDVKINNKEKKQKLIEEIKKERKLKKEGPESKKEITATDIERVQNIVKKAKET